MDNAEMAALLTEGAEALEGIETALATLVKLKARREEHAIARGLVRFAPRAVTGWPTPETSVQGFLAARWQRRDGDSYSVPAGRGIPGPNSPIAGGQDNQAKVDVPSGAPRV